MVRLLILFLFFECFVSSLYAEKKGVSSKNNLAATVSYQTVINGTPRNEGAQNKVICSSNASRQWIDNTTRRLIPSIAKETSYVDYNAQKTYQIAEFSDGSKIHTSAMFSEYPVLTETNETAVILGYTCKHAKTSLRSNSIDIWYTTETGMRGTPSMAYGLPDGLVLKIVRNGNYELVAKEIKPIKNLDEPIIPENKGENLDLQLYKHRITESLVTTISIFNNEQISFGNEINNPEENVSEKTFKFSSGTVLLKKVKLPVVPDDTQLFVELYQHSNGDAYDRTGSVFIIPVEKEKSFLDALKKGIKNIPSIQARNGKTYQGVVATENYQPLIEILRFFTPFGIGQFNDKSKVYGQHWEDSTLYKQDVSELLPVLQGEQWIGIFIGNYDKGGHKVSLKFKYYPGSMEITEKAVKKYWISPLFNTVNVMEMSGQEYGTMFSDDSLKVEFDVPEGVKNVHFRYITTGHGGWDGGDEFNPKMNTIIFDKQTLFEFTPWKSDCATYRRFNPASGNFWNGLTSSDYSRSGWCPGTATNPVYYPMPQLSPGKHQIKVAIPMGKNEGGSFSSWNISGVLIGELE